MSDTLGGKGSGRQKGPAFAKVSVACAIASATAHGGMLQERSRRRRAFLQRGGGRFNNEQA